MIKILISLSIFLISCCLFSATTDKNKTKNKYTYRFSSPSHSPSQSMSCTSDIELSLSDGAVVQLTPTSSLGKGAFGDVRLFSSKDLKHQVAVKQHNTNAEIIFGGPEHEHEMLLKAFPSRHHAIFESVNFGSRIIMPYHKHNSLRNLQLDGQISNQNMMIVINKAINIALSIFEENDVLHIDLHPGNILVSRDQDIELIDWGCSITKENQGIIDSTAYKLQAVNLARIYCSLLEETPENESNFFLSGEKVESLNDFMLFYEEWTDVLNRYLPNTNINFEPSSGSEEELFFKDSDSDFDFIDSNSFDFL